MLVRMLNRILNNTKPANSQREEDLRTCGNRDEFIHKVILHLISARHNRPYHRSSEHAQHKTGMKPLEKIVPYWPISRSAHFGSWDP